MDWTLVIQYILYITAWLTIGIIVFIIETIDIVMSKDEELIKAALLTAELQICFWPLMLLARLIGLINRIIKGIINGH